MSWLSEKNAAANTTTIAPSSSEIRDAPRRARTADRVRRRGSVAAPALGVAVRPAPMPGARGRTIVAR